MIKPVWTNNDTSLFWIRDGKPVYLKHTEVMASWLLGLSLTGIMPQARILNEIENGATLELTIPVCKQRDIYDPDDVIVRFTNCRIRKKYMPDLIETYTRTPDLIKLHLVLDCDIELCEV